MYLRTKKKFLDLKAAINTTDRQRDMTVHVTTLHLRVVVNKKQLSKWAYSKHLGIISGQKHEEECSAKNSRTCGVCLELVCNNCQETLAIKTRAAIRLKILIVINCAINIFNCD